MLWRTGGGRGGGQSTGDGDLIACGEREDLLHEVGHAGIDCAVERVDAGALLRSCARSSVRGQEVTLRCFAAFRRGDRCT